jgi:hypothetical protein
MQADDLDLGDPEGLAIRECGNKMIDAINASGLGTVGQVHAVLSVLHNTLAGITCKGCRTLIAKDVRMLLIPELCASAMEAPGAGGIDHGHHHVH